MRRARICPQNLQLILCADMAVKDEDTVFISVVSVCIRSYYIFPEQICLPASERRRDFPVSRIHLKTLEGGISADVIPAERREDHKFCNAVSGEGFLQESIDHYKSKQTAGVLFMYEEGIPVFFCKIQVKPWIIK